MISGTVALPFILADAMCIGEDVVKADLLGTIAFVSGLVTLMQVMIGSR